MSDEEEGKGAAMVRAGKPLEHAMFLFNPPTGMDSAQMRRKARWALLVGVVVQIAVFWSTPIFLKTSGGLGQVFFFLFLMFYGLGFLLVPASVFRLMYGVPNPDDGNGIIRGFVAFVLFVLSCFASCYLYANLTR